MKKLVRNKMFKANIEEKNDHLLVKLIGDLDVYSKEDLSLIHI